MSEKKSILVIDDEADLVKILKFRLEKNGYRVATAPEGETGLRIAKEMRPDLIILDVNMPKMGGLEFYKKVSDEFGRPRFPILILTARGELKDLFRDIKADGFMSKPFEIDELLKKVGKIINRSRDLTVFIMDFEDSPHVQEIKRLLTAENCKVVVVENLESLKEAALRGRPDIIFMEYMQAEEKGADVIPKINGFFTAQFGGLTEAYKKPPVAVYSYSGFDYKDKSLGAGADKYMGKPGRYEEFIRVLRELSFNERS